MKVVFRNGKEIRCCKIILDGLDILADGVILLPVADVEKIEDDEE